MKATEKVDEFSVNLPLVDTLYHDMKHHAYDMTFAPEDNISHSEKEMVEVSDSSGDGKRIHIQLESLARLLKSKKRIERVTHGGGEEFEIRFSGGRVQSLSELSSDAFALRYAYRSLQDIAMTEQVVFILQGREVDAIVA